MRVAIIGVGLIGGSIGMAARERGLAEVTGFARNPERGAEALGLGAVDSLADSIPAAVDGAEIVFCCVSVGAMASVVAEALDAAAPETVVTDVGSTKQELFDAFGTDSRFVGGHPLAGSETAGVTNARADLYEGARWYLTPGKNASGLLYDRLQKFISAIGARPMAIEAGDHDRAMAEVSHLPHVFANQLARQGAEGTERLGALAPSLRDATRVAGANPAIWQEIFATNHDALVAAIGSAIEGLEEARAVISSADPERIGRWQEEAREMRVRLSSVETEAGPTHELRVIVPNRPGILAEVALALGGAGVNIADMSLDPAPDMSSGAISVWVAGEEEARRAEKVLDELGHPVTSSDGV
jgi:prephenate dehydrogenase